MSKDLFPAPHPDLRASVIIPCKNEAERLPSALAAFHAQRELDESWEVLLLVNNSSDGSFEIARRFQCDFPRFPLYVADIQLPLAAANVGYVRRLLMDTAYARLHSLLSEHSLILSTDADTQVAPDWVARNLAEMRNGAEAIGGRILIAPEDLGSLDSRTRHIQQTDNRYRMLLSRLEDYCDPQAHDPWPRHYQHFAASFAVQPETYRRVGGLPSQEALEDVAFYELLTRRDVKFRHSPEVVVQTSGRLDGRAKRGLAEQMRRWSHGPEMIHVPSIRSSETIFCVRNELRRLWVTKRQSEAGEFAARFGFLSDEVTDALRSPWFGEAAEILNLPAAVKRMMGSQDHTQTLDDAVAELERRFASIEVPRRAWLREARSGIAALEIG